MDKVCYKRKNMCSHVPQSIENFQTETVSGRQFEVCLE